MYPAFLPPVPVRSLCPAPRPDTPATATAPQASALATEAMAVCIPRTSRRVVIAAFASGCGVCMAAALAPEQRACAAAAQPSAGTQKKRPKFTRDESGISYLDMKVGTGPSPAGGDFVIVDWVAYLSDGTVFDNTSSAGRNSVVFQMGKRKVIPGLEIALSTMKQGGVRKVVVPPGLAYGERGVCFQNQGCLIPPGETLEYDLTLKRVAIAPL